MNYTESSRMRERCHRVIPGGAHTYSKGDDQFPELSPGFIRSGKGCLVTDVDGNEFMDYGMGLRSTTLGYCCEEVDEAVISQIRLGNNFTRPSDIETVAAERLVGLIDGMDMVKFAKNGSTATTAAVKLARAYTGRDLVAVCAQHPFFSYDDWFIGSTPMKAGIPEAIQRLTVSFRYNDADSLAALFKEYPGQIACVILEPATQEEPREDFLGTVKTLTHENGAVFILDEMITGFRWHLKGAQHYYGVVPDLATFGKGMANGYSVAALAGRRDIMELGSIHGPHERLFLISTTHGAENLSLAAFLKTVEIYERDRVTDHFWRIGGLLQEGLRRLAEANSLTEHVEVLGPACSFGLVFRDREQAVSMPLRTLFLQETIRRGVLMPYIAISQAHTEAIVDRTLDAADEALKICRKALDQGIGQYLVGPAVKPVFRKHN